jgi:hypothetical protein
MGCLSRGSFDLWNDIAEVPEASLDICFRNRRLVGEALLDSARAANNGPTQTFSQCMAAKQRAAPYRHHGLESESARHDLPGQIRTRSDVLKVPGDPLDDVADDVRYGIYTFITSSEKPKELLAREAIAPLAAQGDLTSCLIRWQQWTEDPPRDNRPARLGRYRR